MLSAVARFRYRRLAMLALVLLPTAGVADDTTPPLFSGMSSLSLDCPSLTLQMSWPEATDDVSLSATIRYRLYLPSFGSVGPVKAETAPGATALSLPVAPGDSDSYLVRAVDEAGNEDSNLRVIQATVPEDCGPPATDHVAPTFTGLSSVAAGPGSTAILTWDPAIDDQTSTAQIRYRLYLPSFGTVGTPHGTSEPGDTTLSLPVTRGVTYYFLIRAVDRAGNEDSNLQISSFRIPDSTGVLPESAYTFKCESAFSKASIKLVGAIAGCHRSLAKLAMAGEVFDLEDCKLTAHAKYQKVLQKLADRGCPPCIATNGPAVADRLDNHLGEHNGSLFCDGTVPLQP